MPLFYVGVSGGENLEKMWFKQIKCCGLQANQTKSMSVLLLAY